MSQRKTLLEVNYHSDDDTGMYKIGEIDFGIHGEIDEYLKQYGMEGKNEIISTLAYLIYEVEKKFRDGNFRSGAANVSMNKNSITLN